jgi:hypothetical protein
VVAAPGGSACGVGGAAQRGALRVPSGALCRLLCTRPPSLALPPAVLCEDLEVLRSKEWEGPKKKHGNIPL